MRLRAKPLERRYAYRGIVKIGRRAGFEPGEYVAVFRKREMAAKVWTEHSEEMCIWLDKVTPETRGSHSVMPWKLRE